jgi:hypothetical protein
MRALILTLLLLAACGEKPNQPAANETEAETVAPAVQPLPKPAASTAKAFSVEGENDLYSFKFGWSAEAAAVPELAKRFTTDLEKTKTELGSTAKADRDERRKEGYDFHPYETQVSYETAGQSDRLLSLESAVYSFTGGAHGSSGSDAILWDRVAARELKIVDLLQPGQSWTGAIRQPFCVLLDREREARRGEPVDRSDMFGECPKYEELTVIISDDNRNGRFDHLKVIADQYVAGPYAEGPYEILLPITAAMIERLKPEYRGSFEPRPPVK